MNNLVECDYTLSLKVNQLVSAIDFDFFLVVELFSFLNEGLDKYTKVLFDEF